MTLLRTISRSQAPATSEGTPTKQKSVDKPAFQLFMNHLLSFNFVDQIWTRDRTPY